MPEVIVSCTSVSKNFRRKNGEPFQILKNINVSIEKGEIVTITGKSGSGKTTLLGLLAGIDRFDSGSITLFGSQIERLTENEAARLRREHISIIFQNHNLIPTWTAVENVEAALANHGLTQHDMLQKATAMLSSLGLAGRLHNLPSEMSAGEQQRVAVGRALITNPSIILADEPVADVDPATAEEILSLILKSASATGAAVILATHATPPAGFTKRILTLKDGVLV